MAIDRRDNQNLTEKDCLHFPPRKILFLQLEAPLSVETFSGIMPEMIHRVVSR